MGLPCFPDTFNRLAPAPLVFSFGQRLLKLGAGRPRPLLWTPVFGVWASVSKPGGFRALNVHKLLEPQRLLFSNGHSNACFVVFLRASTKRITQLFSGTLFPLFCIFFFFFFGGCPTRNGLPQKGFLSFFSRVTEQLRSSFCRTLLGPPGAFSALRVLEIRWSIASSTSTPRRWRRRWGLRARAQRRSRSWTCPRAQCAVRFVRLGGDALLLGWIFGL